MPRTRPIRPDISHYCFRAHRCVLLPSAVCSPISPTSHIYYYFNFIVFFLNFFKFFKFLFFSFVTPLFLSYFLLTHIAGEGGIQLLRSFPGAGGREQDIIALLPLLPLFTWGGQGRTSNPSIRIETVSLGK